MTRQEQVLDYLKKNGSITVLTCIKEIGTTELRTIVSKIEKTGKRIPRISEAGTNRYGEKIHYTRYFRSEKEKLRYLKDIRSNAK